MMSFSSINEIRDVSSVLRERGGSLYVVPGTSGGMERYAVLFAFYDFTEVYQLGDPIERGRDYMFFRNRIRSPSE